MPRNLDSQLLDNIMSSPARGNSVESLTVLFQGTGMQRVRSGTFEGYRALELINPEPGDYKVTVVTRQPENVHIDVS